MRKTIPLIVLSLGACADSQQPRGHLQVEVAPLQLQGIAAACYGLRAVNADDEVVWTRSHLCSTRYGNGPGGDIAFVGPCDADGGEHTVHLTIEGLYLADTSGDGDFGAGDARADFVDPCAAPFAADGCVAQAICEPDADVPVRFDLTVMRSASQGFFDVAVNFEDIFCSAKVDCEYGPDQPIELLLDPSGARLPTVVFALSCSDGSSAAPTYLYMNDLEVTCGGLEHGYDVAAGPGYLDPAPGGPVQRYAVYEGRDLSLGGASGPDGIYWNVALGLSEAYFTSATTPKDCTLRTRATATSGPRAQGRMPAETYPIIDFTVPLTDGDGERVCTRHPLGSPELTTTYTNPAVPVQLCNEAEPIGGNDVATTSIPSCPDVCVPVPPPNPPGAATYRGVLFPGGAASFADGVVSFDPLFQGGPAATSPFYQDPNATIGPPDWTTDLAPGAVSLGHGGRLVVRFDDNALRGSGDAAPDLHIFEVGGDVESMFLDISKDGTTWLPIGRIGGAVSSIDVDAAGVTTSDLYRFVRITDDQAQGEVEPVYRGADVDAVGAIATTPIGPDDTCDTVDDDCNGITDDGCL